MLLEKVMFLNISFYHKNKEQLHKNYFGRYILIKDEQVIGDFNSWAEACLKGLALFNNDNFFIKYCS